MIFPAISFVIPNIVLIFAESKVIMICSLR